MFKNAYNLVMRRDLATLRICFQLGTNLHSAHWKFHHSGGIDVEHIILVHIVAAVDFRSVLNKPPQKTPNPNEEQ